MSASIALWSLFLGFMFNSKDAKASLTYSQILMVGANLIPITFYHFVLALLGLQNNKLQKKLLLFGYLITAFLLSTNFTPLFIKNTSYNSLVKCFYPNAGSFFFLFIIHYFVFTGYANFLLYKASKLSTAFKKNQIKYVLFASVIGFVGGATTFPLWYQIPASPLGSHFVWLYTLTITYAILRYRLMDIKVILTRGFILLFVYVFIVGIPLLFALFGKSYLRILLQEKWLYPPLLLYSVLALFAPYIYLQLQNRAERLLLSKSTRLQEELQSAQQKLFQAERLAAAGTMAVGLAHEIRNPLTSIKIFTDYLDDKYNIPEFREKFKKIVHSELDRINSLVEQLLDFSSPKPLKLEPCCVHSLLDETLSLIEPQLSKQNISLKKHYTQDIPLLQIDPKQLKQAILNILLNSLDAMPNRGELIITTTTHSDCFIITISDAGEGIASKDLPHIFDAFYTKKDKGTGLGLAITYKIIKQHRGEISVESTPGKGASFSISLPIDDNLR